MGISYLLNIAILHFLCFDLPEASAVIHRNNETDRLALLEFKAKINDPLGVTNSWNSSLHFCLWYGVVCGKKHQRVTMLDLSSFKLSGSISPYIGNLSFLRELLLQNNSFSHEIPSQIGQLRRLQMLSLHNNSISGQIPTTISNCSNLVFMNLAYNNLVGEIPAGLSSLLKLKHVYLRHNNLIGTLPPSFGNLSLLEYLHLGENQLHGNLPHSLGKLKKLQNLIIYVNKFSGIFPPSIFNLSLIKIIDVTVNNLQGNLPLDLGISTLPNLQVFSIGANRFVGSIPTSLSNASNLQVLQLGVNNLTGNVPSLDKLSTLWILLLDNNNLGGGKADDLKFLSVLSNTTNLVRFSISYNNFGGMLPEQFCNFSKNLREFFFSSNQIIGKIPTGIGDCAALGFLNSEHNRLSGNIPSSIGKLQNLEEIGLGFNELSGSIPSSIGNMTNLILIDFVGNELQGTIPSTLGNCTYLIGIDLSGNNLSGPIPPQIFELSSLSISLGLSQNHLSGSIPNEVENLKKLASLSLYKNKLSGVIPNGLSSCTSLEFLYLDSNLFQGSIPLSLSSLRGLRVLNLSHNMLSGKIPEFLKSFNSLELLNLSYNNLEGIVPVQGIFKNATATSIAGNKNLCGGIPDFKLPPCKHQAHSKRRFTIKLKIIISIVSVFIAAALMLISFFLYYLRKRKAESTSSSFRNPLLKLSYQSLLKATNGFSSDNLIGSGSFGSVYKGILDHEGIAIAVKVLNLTKRGASKSFLAECQALRNIRHRNLVKVLTACSGIDYQGNDFKALVYEFMANGSLNDWLHRTTLGLDEEPRTLNVLQRLNIAIDVACALEYLHHHSGTIIVHCDLKPSNVLLDQEMIGHVSDFGLVKFLSNGTASSSTNQSSSIGVKGTIGYCPPEYGVGSQVSTSGDIFSFGILLLEMFTGKRPTDDIFKEELSLHSFVKRSMPEQVAEVIDPSLLLLMQFNADATSNHNRNLSNIRKNKLIECLISIFEIGIFCSAESPQERMNISDVVAQLSSFRNKLLQERNP